MKNEGPGERERGMGRRERKGPYAAEKDSHSSFSCARRCGRAAIFLGIRGPYEYRSDCGDSLKLVAMLLLKLTL